jgi:hypothetical protein
LYQLMMSKLKAKVDHPGVINKALKSEHKVIYKYKDVEEGVVKCLASEALLKKMHSTEVMKAITAIAAKAREGKP